MGMVFSEYKAKLFEFSIAAIVCALLQLFSSKLMGRIS